MHLQSKNNLLNFFCMKSEGLLKNNMRFKKIVCTKIQNTINACTLRFLL